MDLPWGPLGGGPWGALGGRDSGGSVGPSLQLATRNRSSAPPLHDFATCTKQTIDELIDELAFTSRPSSRSFASVSMNTPGIPGGNPGIPGGEPLESLGGTQGSLGWIPIGSPWDPRGALGPSHRIPLDPLGGHGQGAGPGPGHGPRIPGKSLKCVFFETFQFLTFYGSVDRSKNHLNSTTLEV